MEGHRETPGCGQIAVKTRHGARYVRNWNASFSCKQLEQRSIFTLLVVAETAYSMRKPEHTSVKSRGDTIGSFIGKPDQLT
jgi:hypothetical protein